MPQGLPVILPQLREENKKFELHAHRSPTMLRQHVMHPDTQAGDGELLVGQSVLGVLLHLSVVETTVRLKPSLTRRPVSSYRYHPFCRV